MGARGALLNCRNFTDSVRLCWRPVTLAAAGHASGPDEEWLTPRAYAFQLPARSAVHTVSDFCEGHAVTALLKGHLFDFWAVSAAQPGYGRAERRDGRGIAPWVMPEPVVRHSFWLHLRSQNKSRLPPAGGRIAAGNCITAPFAPGLNVASTLPFGSRRPNSAVAARRIHGMHRP